MVESTETTAKQLTRVPDKVFLLFLALVAVVAGWAMSYTIFQQNQKTLLGNDQRLLERIDKVVDASVQRGLDINTLTVKLESLIDKVNEEHGT